MQNLQLPAGQSDVVTAIPVTGDQPGGLVTPGSFAWSTPDPATGLTVTPAADGLSATIRAASNAPPATTPITVTFQNSNGSTGTPQFTVTVPAQPATTLVFSFGTPFANP